MNIIPIDAMLQEETHNLISLKILIFRLLTAMYFLSSSWLTLILIP